MENIKIRRRCMNGKEYKYQEPYESYKWENIMIRRRINCINENFNGRQLFLFRYLYATSMEM